LPDERLGVATAPLLLLSRPDVRQDLGLSREQAAEADRAITDLYVRALSLRGQSGPQVLEGRRAILDAERTWFEAHLSPEQRKRLIQVDLQWEGPSSLVSRPVVGDTLGLTADQRATLARAVAARDAARARRVYSPADEQALAHQALSVLTPPQRERWRAMLGRPFVPQRLSGRGPTATVR
jgi:hypothetical protein